jgi:hypothetical protein
MWVVMGGEVKEMGVEEKGGGEEREGRVKKRRRLVEISGR